MAEVKNFGLIGIGSSVQLGKGGSRIKSDLGMLQFRNADDSAFAKVQGADPTVDDDLITLRYLNNLPGINIDDGMDLPLGTPGDGTFVGGAVSLTDTDTVTNAIDSMNEILGLLVPAQPPTWPNGSAMTISGAQNRQLADGAVPDNTGDGIPAAGTTVTTLFATTYTTTTAGNTGDNGSGPGTSGTVTAVKNGAGSGLRALTSDSDVGTYDDLNIQENADYPSATPGFWRNLRARALGSVPAGYNKIQITHSDANNTPVRYWVADDVAPSAGAVTAVSAADNNGTVSYSSSVPHYNSGQPVTVSGTLNNIAGYVYLRDNAVSITTYSQLSGNGAVVPNTNYSFGDTGMPADPRPVNDTGQTFTVNPTTGNVHASGLIRVTHTNPRASGTANISSPTLLVMGSATTSAVDEDNISASTFTNNLAYRVDLTGDTQSPTPDATFTGTSTNWDGSVALEAFDAAVVGGRLSHNRTNYSSGYLPVGPDLTSQSTDTQYITFALSGVKSKFTITVSGSYASSQVKLPGVSDTANYSSGGAENGWWDMSIAYAGAGVPGDGPGANGSFGCAEGNRMTGAGGTFTCTFGQETSANSTNNVILVRLGLSSGQSITALSFGSA